jgi:FtsZ-binding cell division protein ZapB
MYVSKEVLKGNSREFFSMQFVHRRNHQMKPPSERILKTADIAEITGLSEQDIRDIAHRHGNRVPSQKVGRVQVYNEKAAALFIAIAQEESGGKTEDLQNKKETVRPPVKNTSPTNASSRLSSLSASRGEERKRETAGPSVKNTAPTHAPSRLSSLSASRGEEKKRETTAIRETAPVGRVPTQLIDTVAMQGQQFSRFADRLAALENAARTDREMFRERIELLERQVAALQEQMEAVDSWIRFSDTRMDAEEARTNQLAEETHAWTEYVRGELGHVRKSLAYLRLSWWKRRQEK